VLDEMRYFNGMREDLDAAVARLDDIGGPNSHCNFPWGWAQAGNTPLKWYKQNTHGGGVRDPLIVHWPARIGAPGEIRRQFCHVIDLTPTILDLLGIAPPTVVAGVPQMPIHGASLAPALSDAGAATSRATQYFEMLGHRGIWHRGWKAVTHHESGKPFGDDRWELYNLDEDFSEYVDLADQEPARLREMVEMWWAEAERNGVLPLDDRGAALLFRAAQRPGLPTSRLNFAYYPPLSHLVADACPSSARGWTTTVDLEHPAGASDGAIVARGSANSGFVLYVRDGQVKFDYNCFHNHTVAAARSPLAPGRHTIAVEVSRREKGGAHLALAVDGETVAEAEIPTLLRIISSTGMDLGRSMSPVNAEYAAPFTYPGRIYSVKFALPAAPRNGEIAAQVRAAMTRQ
jgi:N-sulphoglucosamine sulphohydrolase, C-terminal